MYLVVQYFQFAQETSLPVLGELVLLQPPTHCLAKMEVANVWVFIHSLIHSHVPVEHVARREDISHSNGERLLEVSHDVLRLPFVSCGGLDLLQQALVRFSYVLGNTR